LGYASGGVKITLINVNNLRLWTADNPYTGADVEQLNRDQFHTMHHEFSHILHQTKSYPSAFGLVTAGNYDPRTWGERDSVETNSLGYLTNYGSSATYEDFVETLSCTITDSDYAWMNYIINACMNTGIDDKQKVYDLIDSLGIANLDNPGKPWNNFTVKKESVLNTETNKYEETGRYISSFHENNVKIQNEAKNITARYTNVKSFTSFRDYLDNWVESTGNPNAGINAILTKIETARKWHQEKWGLELFALRREVRARQDKINDYVKANVTIYDY
jgi:glutaredoxin-related protein